MRSKRKRNIVNSGTWEVEIGRITVLGRLGQKISETLSQSPNQVWWYTAVIQTMWEA
jgi:hypothetical protein